MEGTQFRSDPPEAYDATERTKVIMNAAGILRAQINKLPNSPARDNALARLEEAVMWAIQGL